MNFYCVDTDAQGNGDHKVHRNRCEHKPNDKIELGPFPSCHEAVQAAKKYYKQVRGCRYCCIECYE